MKKQELEALRRLEEELLASDDYEKEFPENTDFDDSVFLESTEIDNTDILDDTWLDFLDSPDQVFNTDDADIDLEAYSQEVYQGNAQGSVPIGLVLLTVLLLLVVIFCLLKMLGVV